MKQKDLSPATEGIIVTFERSKQQGQVKMSKFLIPRFARHPGQPDPAKIVELYLNELKKWVNVSPENELFFKGTEPAFGKSRFNQQYLGIGTMRKIPSQVALRLGIPNPDRYSGTNQKLISQIDYKYYVHNNKISP